MFDKFYFSQFWITNFWWQNDLVMGRIWVGILHESCSNMSQLSNGSKIRSFGPGQTKLRPNEQTLFIRLFLYSGSAH